MKKSTILYIAIILLYSCNNPGSCIKTETEFKYNIETITYWDIQNQEKDTIPFIIVKVDTINDIGASARYTDKGKLYERIVIMDEKNAIKLDYLNDTISASHLCHYKVRKNHKAKNDYSIVIW